MKNEKKSNKKIRRKKGRGFLLAGILTAVAGMLLAPKLRAKKLKKVASSNKKKK